jgi:soluble lytic murein transglycosylase-like protein
VSIEAVLARVATLEARIASVSAPPRGSVVPTPPAPAPPVPFEDVLRSTMTGSYAPLFSSAGEAHGVDPRLLEAVAQVESGMDPSAVSPAGAQGLMQLMPATAAGLGVTDPFDPTQAIDGAARLLRRHLDRFGSVELALAAYNAGAGAVTRHGGIPPYPETQQYVRRVLDRLGAAS